MGALRSPESPPSREGRAARTLNDRARATAAWRLIRRVGSARGAAYERGPGTTRECARRPCRFAREEPDRRSEARRGKRDPANELADAFAGRSRPAARRCVGRPDGPTRRRERRVVYHVFGWLSRPPKSLVDVEKSRLFARHASWTFRRETGFHGRPHPEEKGKKGETAFQTRPAPMDVLGRRPQDGGFADPDGGFADPEAVFGTDEDVSMSGDPNATGTPRASRGFVAAVISLTMTAVGSVVLSLPQVFAECGAVGGVAALAGFAALTDASLVILARAARTVDARTYEQTVTRVVGRDGRLRGADLPVRLAVRHPRIAADHRCRPRGARRRGGDVPRQNRRVLELEALSINTGVFALVYLQPVLSLLENLSQLARRPPRRSSS